jgi:hypothetical protein
MGRHGPSLGFQLGTQLVGTQLRARKLFCGLGKMDIICVGGEYGGAGYFGTGLGRSKIRLNKVLKKHCRQRYNDEVPSIVLALRVEGCLKSRH